MPSSGSVGRARAGRSSEVVRRSLDLSLAVAGLVALSPLLGLVAAAVRLSDGGPALHRGERIGRGEVPFRLYKFRTMVPGADRQGPGVTGAEDRRVTRLGRW
ncbi:MAG TPA: sugar transferase, partial [Gemmatimonadota bacterium]|nr:sugar transferase [Gemmatimonadota bacterium]